MTKVALLYLDTKSDDNVAILLPMNPQQRAMTEDTITKNYFPSKREPNEIYSSDTFTEFLKTNAMTKEGLQQIASFYEVLDEWEKATTEQTLEIKHYFDLLLMVKKQSKKDQAWISFYEGLHRHAVLMMCLLSSKLDLVANEVTYGSLTAEYIRTKVSIKEIMQPNKTPAEQLIEIYIDKDINAPMLTTLLTIKAFIPNLQVSDIKNGDLDLLLKASSTYSENISNTNRTSANKSMTINLADILDTIGKMSKPEDQNNENLWPFLTDTFKRQINVTLSAHLQNMTKKSNNDYACYQCSDKLKGQKWSKYSLDGMNLRLRCDYAKTLPSTGRKKGKISVPLGLHFETFTDDVPAETNKNRGQKNLDASHLNAFTLIPPITTILNAKLLNKTLGNMVNGEANTKIISYNCRYQYWTKPSTNNKVHPALIKYCPSSTSEFKKNFFINNLMGYD
jgi:hypothetical protein